MRAPVIGALTLVLVGELTAQEPHRPPSAWNVTLGGAALVYPRYPGSDEYRVMPLPMAQVGFRNRVYLGHGTAALGVALGAYAVQTPRVGIAAEVGLLDNRPESRADALAGMADRKLVATAGASLTYRTGPIEGVVAALRGINDDAGFLGITRVSVSRRFGRLMASTGVNATFADARQMRRDFGVTETEAIRRRALIVAGDSRLEPDEGNAYQPGGGLRDVGASLSLMYILSPRWSVIGFGGVQRLSDEATDSPLVRRREQFTGGLGLAFRLIPETAAAQPRSDH